MREIKFRAWDTKKQGWIEKFTLYPGGKLVGVNHAYGNIKLVQYTGLKDKNGKEIYEGDILSWDFNGISVKVVTFSKGAFRIEDMDNGGLLPPSKQVEVVGNIYKNPELLKS